MCRYDSDLYFSKLQLIYDVIKPENSTLRVAPLKLLFGGNYVYFLSFCRIQ